MCCVTHVLGTLSDLDKRVQRKLEFLLYPLIRTICIWSTKVSFVFILFRANSENVSEEF